MKKKKLTAFDALKELDRKTKAEVYITGGYVRDFIRRKKNKDLDIVVRNISLKAVKLFLSKYGKVKDIYISNGKFSFPLVLFKVLGDDTEVQIALPRRGARQTVHRLNTLKDDGKHRDFTLNAMFLPINFKSRKNIIDNVGGVESIRSRLIVAVGNPDDRIMESPIRIMRAFSIAARLNYTLDKSLTDAIKRNRELVNLAPAENIRDELNDILLSSKPSRYLKLMKGLGVLAIVMPELYRCANVTQDSRYHKYDVFRHCIYTCDNSEPDLVSRLSAILHDIGKPDARKETFGVKKGVSFHRHEVYSVEHALEFMTRLKYDKDTIARVLHLVENHMYHYTSDVLQCPQNTCFWKRPVNQINEIPIDCPECGTPLEKVDGWGDAAVRRFMIKAGINESNINDLDNFPLFKLRSAERLGNGLKPEAVTDKQRDFQVRLQEVFAKSRGLTRKDLNIDGQMIMEMFNLNPSQKIGEILNHLLQKIIEVPKNNKKIELIKLTAEFLFKERENADKIVV